MSNYIDSLFNKTMETTMEEIMPINVGFLGKYPDFFAFALVMLVTGKFIIIFSMHELFSVFFRLGNKKTVL